MFVTRFTCASKRNLTAKTAGSSVSKIAWSFYTTRASDTSMSRYTHIKCSLPRLYYSVYLCWMGSQFCPQQNRIKWSTERLIESNNVMIVKSKFAVLSHFYAFLVMMYMHFGYYNRFRNVCQPPLIQQSLKNRGILSSFLWKLCPRFCSGLKILIHTCASIVKAQVKYLQRLLKIERQCYILICEQAISATLLDSWEALSWDS